MKEKIIGEIIKEERLKLGLSQKKLAEKSKISNSFLCDIEKNRTIPSVSTLINIGNALEIEDFNIFLNNNYVNTDKNNSA